MNRQKITLAATAILMLLGACNKTSNSAGTGVTTPASEPAPTAAPAASAKAMKPDRCGRYEVEVELPPRLPCKADTDCAWTAHRPGECIPPLCPGHFKAGTRAWVAAADKLFADVCGERQFKVCIRVKCVFKKPKAAACKEGKCALVF